MYNHVVNCKDAKHIWETIETINEGTEEVRENIGWRSLHLSMNISSQRQGKASQKSLKDITS